jgi:uncharacterized protein YbjT (DUF2867 family)
MSNANADIAVIGAGGRTGRALVTALSSAGIKVRALIHREAQRRHDELNPGFDAHRLFTPIDLEDLTDAVTDILIQNGHEFATYELVGSETLAFVDMAAALSQVLGKTVRARAVPAQHFVDTRGAARGFGASALLDLRAMLDYYNNHGLVGNGRVLRMILKRDSTTFLESAKRELTLQAAGGASKLSRS